MIYNKIHLYYGDGKGKTTAATGLAVRAAGSDMTVVYCQFLKNGSSGELNILRNLPGIYVLTVQENFGFTWNMSAEQHHQACRAYTQLFLDAINHASKPQLIVFDEIVDAINTGLLDKELFIDSINNIKEDTEIVLTGHNPAEFLIEMADYVSCITKEKHPFDKNLQARKGIEF